MDFVGRFLLINTVVLGVALSLLAWNWRKARDGVPRRNRVQPPSPHEYTNPGELEKRANKAVSEVKTYASQGNISSEEKERLKSYQGAFYAHHYAANVYLMQGAYKAYQAELTLAEKELIAMEATLKDLQPSPESSTLAPSPS